MKRTFLFAASLWLTAAGFAPAATSASPAVSPGSGDLTSLVRETQKMQDDADHICMSWWIPTEYWERSFAQNPQVTPQQKDDMLKTLAKYTLVAVVDAKKGGLAMLDYAPKDDVIANTKITAPNGKTYNSLPPNDLTPAAKNLFSILQPLMANMLGQFGQNLTFVVFPGQDSAGKRLVDPLAPGKLIVSANGHPLSYRLPLGSLLPEKTCDTCGEHFPGNYNVCPYDGTKLK